MLDGGKNSSEKNKHAIVPLLIVGFAFAMFMVAVFIHLMGGNVGM